MARPYNQTPSSGGEKGGSRYHPRAAASLDEDTLTSSGNRRGYTQSFGGNTSRTNSAPTEPKALGSFEAGVVEKVMGRYGFIVCHDRDLRIFFHVSQLAVSHDLTTDDYKPGVEVEFRVDKDARTGKPVAIQIRQNPSAQRPAVERISLSGGRHKGVVDIPAKQKLGRRTRSLPQSAVRGGGEMGRLSFTDNGEAQVLQFSFDNVADKRYPPQKGDQVSFYVGIEKLTQRTEALSVTVVEDAPKEPLSSSCRGIVCDRRETFGFIEREDTRTRIFFHYSELTGPDPQVGSSVEFVVREQQDGRQCACRVVNLPEGSVRLEDIEGADRVGTVEVGIDSSRKGEETQYGRLNCVINGSSQSLEFSDREFDGNFTVSPGDRVHFRCRAGPNGQRKAISVTLIEMSPSSLREKGVISTLKESSHFGFIRCCEREDPARVFFHFTEWMGSKSRPNPGDEVEFEFVETPGQRKAVRIERLAAGSVEVVSSEISYGVVQSTPRLTRGGSRSSVGNALDNRDRDMEPGHIRLNSSSDDAAGDASVMVSYQERDCTDARSVPCPGDEVAFRICENRCTGRMSAVKLAVIRAAEVLTEQGFVVALKSNFGFIEVSDHREQLYFKFKNDEYRLMDEVSFIVGHRGGRKFAEEISILPPGTINEEVSLDYVINGVVVKPINDESLDSYAGQVEIPSSSLQTLVGSKTESCSTEQQPYQDTTVALASEALAAGTTLSVPFTVLSLSDIRATPQKGEQVIFSLAVRQTDGTLHAVNLTQKKTLIRGRVDSLKDQFGFIVTEESSNGGGESLFFHESEVILDDEAGDRKLEVGDMVEFNVVYNHKRGKSQACNVHRVLDARPDRLSRKVEIGVHTGFRCSLRRQPRKPDGTNGFNLPLVERTCGEYFEVQLPESDTAVTAGGGE